MSKFRQESDSLGCIDIPVDALWGAQTQRSLHNFRIGEQRFPAGFIRDFALVKKACALTNLAMGELSATQCELICAVCDEIIAGAHDQQFPLVVWQTGSGTQTNMNLNEVIANRANEIAGTGRGAGTPIHPNDHVNRSQSSNDIFPTVMHVSAARTLREDLLPALNYLHTALKEKSVEFRDLIKTGRTHLMDATPVTLGQEFGGYAAQLAYAQGRLTDMLPDLHTIALGGSAVGTGLNTPPGWSDRVAALLSEISGSTYTSADNKFMALAAHDVLVDLHGRLRLLATALFKIANDLRLLSSGPRCGLGELRLPANEPGSSIMPGKINPTQAEAMTMVAVQVMGNDTAVGLAGSQGHLELNVYKPVLIHNVLESLRLLADGMRSFAEHCVIGITADGEQLRRAMERSLMLVTALSPVLGYDKAAAVAKRAWEENLTLKQAALAFGYISEEDFDRYVNPLDMLGDGS